MTPFTLHLIFSLEAWQKAAVLVDNSDLVLFLQDGVYLLQAELNTSNANLYARKLDVNARDIQPLSNITVIDDEKWVELTTAAHNIISW